MVRRYACTHGWALEHFHFGRIQRCQILKDLIADLEREPEQIVPVLLELEHNGKSYSGTAVPILTSCDEGMCQHFDVTLNQKHVGVLRHVEDKWKISEIKSQALANAIGREIEDFYEE